MVFLGCGVNYVTPNSKDFYENNSLYGKGCLVKLPLSVTVRTLTGWVNGLRNNRNVTINAVTEFKCLFGAIKEIKMHSSR